MKPRCRTAFTLVELLVVITIIGMLAALLLPAINHAREAAQSAQCMNNQRNLGKAVQEFDARHGYIPGYRQFLQLKPLVPDSNLNPMVLVNWQVMLLQYLDRDDLFQRLQHLSITEISNNDFTFPYLDMSVCPSDNTIASKSAPWTSYVVNTGRMDQIDLVGTMSTNNNQTVSVDVVDPPQTCKPIMSESFANGVFQDRVWFFPNQSPYPPKKSLSDIKDGQGNTLMLSENLDAGYYTDGPGSDSPMLQLNTTDPQGKWTFDWYQQLTTGTNLPHNCSERGAGFVWWDTSATNTTTNPPPAPTGNLTANGKLSTAKAQVVIINGRRGDFDPTRVGWPGQPISPIRRIRAQSILTSQLVLLVIIPVE